MDTEKLMDFAKHLNPQYCDSTEKCCITLALNLGRNPRTIRRWLDDPSVISKEMLSYIENKMESEGFK